MFKNIMTFFGKQTMLQETRKAPPPQRQLIVHATPLSMLASHLAAGIEEVSVAHLAG